MDTKIRREVANAQPALGRAIVGMKLDEFPQRFSVLLIPAAVFFIECLGIVAGTEKKGVDQIAMCFDIVRPQFQCPTVTSNRLVEFPLVLESVAQVVVCYDKVRLQLQCPTV